MIIGRTSDISGIYREIDLPVTRSCYKLSIGEIWVKDQDCSYEDINNKKIDK